MSSSSDPGRALISIPELFMRNYCSMKAQLLLGGAGVMLPERKVLSAFQGSPEFLYPVPPEETKKAFHRSSRPRLEGLHFESSCHPIAESVVFLQLIILILSALHHATFILHPELYSFPLCNSWILFVVLLCIALTVTPNRECCRMGAVPKVQTFWEALRALRTNY